NKREQSQRDDVRVDGPLQSGDRGTEIRADRRQRDVDDRGVDADDKQAHTADPEPQELSATAHTGDGSRDGLMDQLSGLNARELTDVSRAPSSHRRGIA